MADYEKGEDPGQSNKPSMPSSQKGKRTRGKSERKKRSWVWDHFTRNKTPLMKKEEDNIEVQIGHTTRATCKYCSTEFASDSTKNGTSTLQKHLEQHCDHYPGSVKSIGNDQKHLVVDINGEDVVVTHWTQENCTKAAVEMIVIDEMPFSAIEKPGFRRFCKIAIPKWHVPCRKVVVKTFLSMYNAMKEDLKAELKDHCISLTTDTWTSVQNINYMVVTAHFIDNTWTLHKRVLNFFTIPNHQGNTIGKLLEKCLQEWSMSVQMFARVTAHFNDTPLLQESDTEKTLFNMSVQMKIKYKRYFDSIDDMNQLLLVALVLDPRYKLKYFSRVIEKMLCYDSEIVKRKSEQLKDLVITLTDLYASLHGTQSSNTRKENSECGSGIRYSSRQLTGKRALMLEDWEKDLEDGNAVVVAHEVDRYLLDPIEKTSGDFNILTWWRLMGTKYPNLQGVAKYVLSIQVSTVASESCFSTGKRVIDPHRSSLSPRSVEALICLQNWLKSDAITSLAYTPTPEEMEWFERTEQELEQEEKEQKEKMEKQKDNDLVEKKSKAAKASKGADAGNASKN